MKINIILTALIFPLLFACTLSENKAAEPRVKNIILMIGDGMGLAQVSAANTVSRGTLNLNRAQYIGLSKTSSANKYETDSGAGGSAISTGKKTNDQHIAIDENGIPRSTILEIAEKYGLATGLVATSEITHATPASFIAHQPNRYSYVEIAEDFVDSDVDIFIGGGRSHFEDSTKVKITDKLRDRGYTIVYDLKNVDPLDSQNIGCLAADVSMPKISEGRGDFLSRATDLALQKLSQDEDGFFVMIEGSMIDWGCHDMNAQYMIEETIDFDKAVGVAFHFADEHPGTLVIVTADHETGGVSITDGDLETGEIKTAFSTSSHTAVMVPVYAYGTGAEAFAGMYENTEIFHKMLNLFSFHD